MSPSTAILFPGQGSQTARETMLVLHGLSAERLVEVGPGRVLTGLAKRTLRDVELVHA